MGRAEEKYVRVVGGDLVSSVITDTASMRIEVLRRECQGRMYWHFKQPELSLFWFSRGAGRLNATIDGHSVDRKFIGKSQMAIFPAAIEIEGEWDVGPELDYTVVFLNPAFVNERLRTAITNSTIAFEHPSLMRSLAELCREAATPDNVFNLLAEGWSIQALGHIARVSEKRQPQASGVKGGLSARSLKRVEEFVRDNLSQSISLGELSEIAGLSKRHFLRAFQESLGQTPYKYVLGLRIDEAKRQLAETNASVTDVALAAGFGHAQHFSTSFRNVTGETPSSYRQRVSS